MIAHVYILRCRGGSYYTGLTRGELDTRIGQHNLGHFRGYTYVRRPVELLWSAEFIMLSDAFAVEGQIKGWSRAKKKALIRGDYDALVQLSKRNSRASAV